MARVELVRRARQEVLDLDWPLAGAVDEALGLLERDPGAGKALRGRLRGLRSLRVGTYWVIYQLGEGHRLVRVLAVRHRFVAYTTETIKVPVELRDQLKRQAAAERRTLGAHIAHLAELGERESRMHRLRGAIAATPASDLESYRAETREWDRIERA